MRLLNTEEEEKALGWKGNVDQIYFEKFKGKIFNGRGLE